MLPGTRTVLPYVWCVIPLVQDGERVPGVIPHRCIGFVRRPGGDGGGGAGPEGAERREEVLVGLEDCISVLETNSVELESDVCVFF